MAGIVRQADQYGLDDDGPMYTPSGIQHHEALRELAERSGPRIQAGALNHRVSRETSEIDFSALHYADLGDNDDDDDSETDPAPSPAAGPSHDDQAHALGDFFQGKSPYPTGQPEQGGQFPGSDPRFQGMDLGQREKVFMDALGGPEGWHPASGIDKALAPVTRGLNSLLGSR